MKQGTCKHFNGTQHDACLAGVVHKSLPGFPCIRSYSHRRGNNEKTVPAAFVDCCSKYAEPTAEELAADKAESDARHAETMKKIAAAKPKISDREYDVWFDATAPDQEFTHEEMMHRLREVHGIEPKGTKGTRTMACHMDGDTWFSYVWEWEIAGKKFTNSTRQNRRGSNAAMWRR